MRKIPTKNYVILTILAVVKVIIFVYMSNWYLASKEYYLESSIMTDFLGEIKEAEISNYILENPEIIIYVSSDQEDSTKKFEKKLKSYIIKEEIQSHFIYLNCSNLSSDFMKEFQKKYFNGALKTIYVTYPNLFIVENGKVVDVLYKLGKEPNIKDVAPFLEKNGVIVNG